jgi:hypothetical protein
VGTQLREVKDNGAILQMTDGTNTFNLYPYQVTNDLDVLARLSQTNAQSQAAIDAGMQQREAILQAQEQQNLNGLTQGVVSGSKANAIRGLQEQITVLQQQETNLRKR